MELPTRANVDREGTEHLLLLPSSAHSGALGLDMAGAEEAMAREQSASATPKGGEWHNVPWRTIVATIGILAALVAFIEVVYVASDVVVLILIAGFFAIVLNGPVRALQNRASIRQGPAIAIVLVVTLVVVGGLVALFILPVRRQLVAVLTDLPGTVTQASQGRGPMGELVAKLHLVSVVRDHQDALTKAARSVDDSLPSIVSSIFGAVLRAVTVVVLTCLMLTQSRAASRTAVQVVPVRYRARVTEAARDAASAVSGYMIGNLLISVFAGVAAFLLLLALRVPNAVVIALFVAFADMLPLVGATIGAIVAVAAAFFVSSTSGIIAVVFFVVYQQFENSVLQVVIMARRVRANPLVVLLSVLLGVELFGLVGALLAVPVAGALSVIFSSVWRHRPARADELVIVSDGRSEEDAGDAARVRRHVLIMRWLARPFLRWRRHLPEPPRGS